MLLYANDQLWVIAFATAVAIGSKTIFRISVGGGTRHFFNPSNFGITVTLLLFPWVGIVPPYHFTENNFNGVVDWILPSLIVFTGSLLNAKLTKRIPLIAAWVAGFLAQGVIRAWHGDPAIDDTTLHAAITPMTGVAFALFTFYMITDPATTPARPSRQIAFGTSVALAYGLLMISHIVFTMFFALTIVCMMRGFGLFCLASYKASSAVATDRRTRMTLTQPSGVRP
jgi:enediyne biosynthesis protein E5